MGVFEPSLREKMQDAGPRGPREARGPRLDRMGQISEPRHLLMGGTLASGADMNVSVSQG